MCIERSVKRSVNWTKEMMHAWFNMSLTLLTYNNNCSLKYTIVKQLSKWALLFLVLLACLVADAYTLKKSTRPLVFMSKI